MPMTDCNRALSPSGTFEKRDFRVLEAMGRFFCLCRTGWSSSSVGSHVSTLYAESIKLLPILEGECVILCSEFALPLHGPKYEAI
jgi:hypothetical protein